MCAGTASQENLNLCRLLEVTSKVAITSRLPLKSLSMKIVLVSPPVSQSSVMPVSQTSSGELRSSQLVTRVLVRSGCGVIA